MDWSTLDLRIQGVLRHYRNKDFTPDELVQYLRERAAKYPEHNIWIRRLSGDELQPYLDFLRDKTPDSLPLYGVPFVIKDNIDLKGIPTTAACAEFATVPEQHAYVVRLLLDAGAVPLGKTNMDQFATGLVGTRSPYGVCHNAFDFDVISGGSSSGSAVAVALGLASFSLGTDTAGSGRVPAALNNLIGLKPTRGLLSTQGVVPACRSLDCVSVFSLTAEDAATVFNTCVRYDQQDPYARRNAFDNSARQTGIAAGPVKIGVPQSDQLEFYGADEYRLLFERTVERWRQSGADITEVDFSSFKEAATLLYSGPWVSERSLVTKSLLAKNPDAMHPVVRTIIEAGSTYSAEQAFAAQYRLQGLKAAADAVLAQVDFILTPTIAKSYTVEEVLSDPLGTNSRLGYYTNFMNLLDYAAVAVPAGQDSAGVPWGVTLFSVAGSDQKLLAWAAAWQHATQTQPGTVPADEIPIYKEPGVVDVVVCGAHLEGQPLNWQLSERGGALIRRTRSRDCYRLYALADGRRPALVRSTSGGAAIEVEVWRLPAAEFGGFVAGIPEPLGIGKVELEDGTWCSGFICEPVALDGATEITHLGGWRRYIEQH